MAELTQPGWKNRRSRPSRDHMDGDGSGCACGIEEILAEASLVKPGFDAIFAEIEERVGPSTTPIVQQKKIKLDGGGVLRGGGRDDERAILKSETRSPTSTAPNKGAPRIAQKCFTKYLKTAAKAQANPLAFINDMVRGTMAFTSCGEMLRALEAIETMQGRRLGDGSLAYAEFQIVRAKQIYEPKSPLLYGDIKLNIRVHTDPAGGEAAPPHNCELQLNIVPMLEGKGTPSGHGAYEKWRDLDDDHWGQHGSELPPKLLDMPDDYRAKAMRIVHSSQDAYRDGAIAFTNDTARERVLAKVSEMASAAAKRVAEIERGDAG